MPIARQRNPSQDDVVFGDYSLPSIIGSTRDGMVSSFTAVAVVATLLASTECAFLGLIKNPPDGSPLRYSGQALQDTVTALTYIAIFLNVGASWSGLRMIDILGKMPFLNAHHEAKLKKSSPDPRRFSITSETTIDSAMRDHGLRGWWAFMAWHSIISLLLGSLCVVIQISMYIWIHEAVAVSVVTTLFAFFASIPIFFSLIT
ncbi:hypothetical protein M407DRAFT_160712 [Tulasnella calospora MUT 4182]|uniref:Uncharacterized protein n=1 Tax=Tulasnella calospora MUT 4182 TaxID=1051891 RepID=A0A0C3Q4M9_9AGAM|nr:hypothetical protein M407DRAFT_160712 [Tulasnella calospora MUT 4182]